MIKEIVKRERERTDEDLGVIYFYKEGNSPWYRAYELSAYYAHFYMNNLDKKERLKVIKKRYKVVQDDIMSVGLRLESFKKYLPDLSLDKINEGDFVVSINLSNYDDINLSSYKEKVDIWKMQYEHNNKIVDKKEDKIKHTTVYNSPITMTSIMKEIIRYDTYGKDENDLRIFIKELKEMCASLI